MKPKLVKNWNTAHKWLSIRLIALAAIWETIPFEAKSVIPDPWNSWITIALIVGAGIGRLIDQGYSLDNEKTK